MFNSALAALYACRNHWSWLYITGDYHKESYIPSKSWDTGCACCQYVLFDRNLPCSKCILNGYAWKDSCMDINHSIYREWFRLDQSQKAERSLYAHKMVMACNRAIENELTNHLALKELTK